MPIGIKQVSEVLLSKWLELLNLIANNKYRSAIMEKNTMQNPIVSFVVPCYKLAHLLPECVNSIISQSFSDFEVLIMDDCSPDNTEEVAQLFHDPRVKHIRNESNLGPLRNYNKGINLSRGKYIWLISADDYLRSQDVLKRYVDILDSNPRVGYTFCPGMEVKNGHETEILSYSQYGNNDRIIDGHTFLKSILDSCFVLAPSALVRRECYETVSLFPVDVVWAGVPIDLVWGGDWYLWSVFALFFDVAYLKEPMVCYRQHELSTSELVTRQKLENCISADIAVPWMVKQKAEEAGFKELSKTCLHAIANEYSRHLTGRWYRSGTWAITLDQFERSLCQSTQNEAERNWIRARAYKATADRYYFRGDLASAKRFFWAGLKKDPTMLKAYAKLMLLFFGKIANSIRIKLIPALRNI
ncbi:MAG: glycosyltransferase family 2 protein [Syntrophales bacterium]